MNRRSQWGILGFVIIVLLLAGLTVLEKPTRLGLDLRGGVELIYEGRPTPQAPTVDSAAIADAISTIRKRTDALGVSEPEIQQAGSNQIIVSLPDVQDPERAIKQVGSTAQLYFYDWEGKVIGEPDAPYDSLWAAVNAAGKEKPTATADDVPVEGVSDAIKKRFNNDTKKIRTYYDQKNDTVPTRYYLFNSKNAELVTGAQSCAELATDWQDRRDSQPRPAPAKAPATGLCAKELAAIGAEGPPAGSKVRSVPQGIVVLKAENTEEVQKIRGDQYYVVEDDAEIAGRDLKSPEQNVDQNTREPIVTFQLTKHGQKSFERVTKRLADRGRSIIVPPGTDRAVTYQRFAISLDGQIVSRATIDWNDLPNGINGRDGAQINGIGGLKEAQDLATQLRIGALPIELKLVSRTQVSATLGEQALKQAEKAFIAGFVLVALFLMVFYRGFGFFAVIALAAYALLMIALVKLIPITLTLPGLAGLVLTLGVAADANIVSFERIKEELRSGSNPAKAIRDGYKKAFKTIVDANVVTIGVAFILFMLATAGVKGFAFTLGVGTLTGLFTAVVMVGSILSLTARTRLMRKPAQGHTARRINFMGAARVMFTISGIIILIGGMFIATKGINFGIDFESGTRIQVPAQTQTEKVETALEKLDVKAEVQQVTDGKTRLVQISLPKLAPDRVTEVKNVLVQTTGADARTIQTDSIGPTFGKQVANAAIIAILASLLLISLYIWYRFGLQFAMPVLIALAHDMLITAGVYAALGNDVTTATVAALLTILGFSLYDTIIVFDRVRENIPKMQGATINQIVNRSMSEVLVRSLVTSVSTLFPILALLIFGGEVLQDFALALLIGVLSGAYSSIFIASPLVGLSLGRTRQMRQRLKTQLSALGSEAPHYSPDMDKAIRDVQVNRRPAAQTEPVLPLEPVVINPIIDDEPIPHPPTPTDTAVDTTDADVGGEDGVDTPEKASPPPKRAAKKKKPHGRPTGGRKKKGHGRR